MSKSKDLIPKIIAAKTKEEATEVLRETLQALHLSTDYVEMTRLQDRINFYQAKFKELTKGLNTVDVVIEYEQLNNIRMSLNYLYREIQDELSAPINSNKIYYEEIKTVRRAEGLSEVRGSDVAKEFKATSASAIREILGASETYANYAGEYSIAYGNYKTLETLLNSIRMHIDSIASREKRELIILQKDAK
jgi:hypothetical protein